MRRAYWTGGAIGGWVLLVAGCTSMDGPGSFFTGAVATKATVSEKDHVVSANVEDVAVALEASMKSAGLRVVASAEGAAVVLESASHKGSRFRILLTREMGAIKGTRAHVEWRDTPDAALVMAIATWMQFLTAPVQGAPVQASPAK